jgi:hypothetical protein
MTESFKKWLHIEDTYLLNTIAAIKISHKLKTDPVWIMIIGPSSDGKTEILRAFTQPGELNVEDITPNSFVSGYMDHGEGMHLAEAIANRIWYIYDFSIILSKHYDIRSQILSNLRMIYDGKITKAFGTKKRISIETPNSTLIAASTPAIDATILEDQILGTRFITIRTMLKDSDAVMDKIMLNQQILDVMRNELNITVGMWENKLVVEDFDLNEIEHSNIKLLTKMTCFLRTTIELERLSREARNIATPESPGRLYKQLMNLYKSYRILGLTEEEAYQHIQKICQDSIIPLRLKVLKYVTQNNGVHSTSSISNALKIGKSTAKGHLCSLQALGLVSLEELKNEWGKVIEQDWTSLIKDEYNILLGGV